MHAVPPWYTGRVCWWWRVATGITYGMKGSRKVQACTEQRSCPAECTADDALPVLRTPEVRCQAAGGVPEHGVAAWLKGPQLQQALQQVEACALAVDQRRRVASQAVDQLRSGAGRRVGQRQCRSITRRALTQVACCRAAALPREMQTCRCCLMGRCYEGSCWLCCCLDRRHHCTAGSPSTPC
jgi:hypothetical protein